MRPRTLPLALGSVAMGSFLAAFHHQFRLRVAILAGLTTILLQILSNLANDYGDAISGIDSDSREGPRRTVQSGVITKNQMLRAIIITTLLTLVSGIWLLITVVQNQYIIWIFLLLGILCIIAAITYTMGKKPYGYAGLGDIAVLIFFGLIGVMGTYFLHATSLDPTLLLPAASFGFLSTGVLNVNNIRDISADKNAGKRSIPVKIGRSNAVIYHWLLLAGAIVSSVVFTAIHFQSHWQWLYLATIPMFVRNGMAVQQFHNSRDLDPFLKQLAMSTLLFVILFGTGLIID